MFRPIFASLASKVRESVSLTNSFITRLLWLTSKRGCNADSFIEIPGFSETELDCEFFASVSMANLYALKNFLASVFVNAASPNIS